MNIIEFKNIYANYHQDNILEDINLTIKKNQHWAILGANGSGKSTLIKLISNDLYPSVKNSHKKEVFGKNRWNIFDLKKHLGIITSELQNYFLTQGHFLTAHQVVLSGYFSSIGIFKHHDFTDKQYKKGLEVLEFLEILELKDKKVVQMSTGQLRRCIIGRALIHEPKAFILDEPTVGLDIKAQDSFMKLIQSLSKNASIILITHHIEEIIPEISNVALIHNKTIFKQGKKEKILTSKNLSKTFGINI